MKKITKIKAKKAETFCEFTFKSTFSKYDLLTNAVSVRLFDRSTWLNLRDGRFINTETDEIKSLVDIQDDIRTVVNWQNKLIAKRKHQDEPIRSIS